jgi:hypothetical protein
MEEVRIDYNIWMDNLSGKGNLGDLDGRKMLKRGCKGM